MQKNKPYCFEPTKIVVFLVVKSEKVLRNEIYFDSFFAKARDPTTFSTDLHVLSDVAKSDCPGVCSREDFTASFKF